MRIYEDLRTVQARIGILQYMVLGVSGLLLVYFWSLQVVRGREFKAQAESNRSRVLGLAAPRGPLLDRHGRILVENRASFNVILTPEHSQNLDEATSVLAQVLQMGEAQIRERVARRVPPRPVVVKADATLEDVAALMARRLELPEVQLEVVPLRSYPLAAAAAHALGRVGEVSERQLQQRQYAELAPGSLVGQAGVEARYDVDLMGRDGFRRIAVNSRGVEVMEIEHQRPADGPQLTLTLDADLQKTLERAFAGRSGSAVALDPRSGEILAMTSIPAYDPNRFTTGIEAGEWSRLVTDSSTPLMNRAIQAQYAPGSLFKLVTATAALEEGVTRPETTYFCPGYLSIYNTVFRCHKPGGHGLVNLHTALAQSCNVYFYQVGVRLEIDRIARYAKRLGLGSPTGVDLPHEAAGLMPSAEWKLQAQKTPWYPGETVSVAIGQGQVTVTPIQMARLAAAIATGRLVHPHLVKAVGGSSLTWPAPRELGLRPQSLDQVRSGMWAVVNEQGTGWRARVPGADICGKTGSAQVVSHARLARGGSDAVQPHGWFVGFAPRDQPRIAFAILVEHGVSGGASAAPVAQAVLARFFGAAPAALPPTAVLAAQGSETEDQMR